MSISKEMETAQLSKQICQICDIDFQRKHYNNEECWEYEYLNFYEPHNFITLMELEVGGVPLGYFIQRSNRVSTLERLYHLLNRTYCLDTKWSIITAIKLCKEWKYQTGLEEIENECKKNK